MNIMKKKNVREHKQRKIQLQNTKFEKWNKILRKVFFVKENKNWKIFLIL